MAVKKSEEQIKESRDEELTRESPGGELIRAKDTITELQKELQSTGQQIQGLKNIVKQVSELFTKMDAMMHTVSHDLENNSPITAGMKLRELSDTIATNQKVLYGITKEWKKE